MAKRLSEEIAYQTKYVTVKDVGFEFSDGKQKTIQVIERNDTALIVPLTQNNEVVLIREFFFAANEFQIGLPKGRIDEGMNALTTANKELQEEIGYRANKLDELGVLTMSPGYHTQKTHVYLAQDLVESKLPGDEDEEIEVLPTPFDEVEQLIYSGEIKEARVITAIFLAKNFLAK